LGLFKIFKVKIDHFVEDLSGIQGTNDDVEFSVGFTGSDFNDTFYLDSMHFHWGEKNGVYTGSEHTIGHTLDGIQYPLEVNVKFLEWSLDIKILFYPF